MAITNYTELQTAVTNWLGRTDLSERVPEFIALAEADIKRNLRHRVVRDSLTLDSAEVSLPSACAELRSVRFATDTRKYPLTSTTAEGLATVRRVGSGVPNMYAVINNILLLDVTPDAAYVTEIIYFEALTALSVDAATNATLTAAPDVYLFGALKEAEPYLEHDERVPLWEAKYQRALNDQNIARERAELGAAPKVIRLPVVFG